MPCDLIFYNLGFVLERRDHPRKTITIKTYNL